MVRKECREQQRDSRPVKGVRLDPVRASVWRDGHPPRAVGLATPLLTTLCSLQKVHSFVPVCWAGCDPSYPAGRGRARAPRPQRSYRPAWATQQDDVSIVI